MPIHDERNDNTQPHGIKRGRLLLPGAIVAVVVVVVLLHVFGVIGPSLHG